MKVSSGGHHGKDVSGKNHSKSRKISVFDINMNFIEEIIGVRETARKYNIKNITSCCNGKCKQFKGYIFRYSDMLNIKYIPKTRKWKSKGNDLLYYDNLGNLIGTYITILEASKLLNTSRNNIYRSLKTGKLINSKYLFIYKNQINELCRS